MKMYLRRAALEDAEIILTWRNDALTRKHSFSKQLIPLEEHLKWFKEKLSDESCDIYILMADEERVGQIRIENADGIGKINYGIAPIHRKKGYGKKILALVEEMPAEGEREYHSFVGMVERENEASRHCFRANGYTELLEGDIFCYIKILSGKDERENV